MQNSIYLPLRSNAHYFTSRAATVELEARLKHLALSYDQIVLQDGCFSWWGMQSLFQPWRDSPRGVFHARLIELGFPDVSNEPWDRVMEIRESAAGRDFRAMLDRVVKEASCGLVDGNDPVDSWVSLVRRRAV